MFRYSLDAPDPNTGARAWWKRGFMTLQPSESQFQLVGTARIGEGFLVGMERVGIEKEYEAHFSSLNFSPDVASIFQVR